MKILSLSKTLTSFHFLQKSTFNTKMKPPIPQMFYLRQVKLKVKQKQEEPLTVCLFVYFNYRRSIKGMLHVPKSARNPREWAKGQIGNSYPEAEFWK